MAVCGGFPPAARGELIAGFADDFRCAPFSADSPRAPRPASLPQRSSSGGSSAGGAGATPRRRSPSAGREPSATQVGGAPPFVGRRRQLCAARGCRGRAPSLPADCASEPAALGPALLQAAGPRARRCVSMPRRPPATEAARCPPPAPRRPEGAPRGGSVGRGARFMAPAMGGDAAASMVAVAVGSASSAARQARARSPLHPPQPPAHLQSGASSAAEADASVERLAPHPPRPQPPSTAARSGSIRRGWRAAGGGPAVCSQAATSSGAAISAGSTHEPSEASMARCPSDGGGADGSEKELPVPRADVARQSSEAGDSPTRSSAKTLAPYDLPIGEPQYGDDAAAGSPTGSGVSVETAPPSAPPGVGETSSPRAGAPGGVATPEGGTLREHALMRQLNQSASWLSDVSFDASEDEAKAGEEGAGGGLPGGVRHAGYLRLGELLNQSVTWIDADISDSDDEEEERGSPAGPAIVQICHSRGVGRSFSC